MSAPRSTSGVDGVELRVVEGEARGIHSTESHVLNSAARQSDPGALDHVRRQVNRHHPTASWVVERAQTGTDADLQDRLSAGRGQARHGMAPPVIKGRAVDQVVDGGQPFVDSLDRVRDADVRCVCGGAHLQWETRRTFEKVSDLYDMGSTSKKTFRDKRRESDGSRSR